MLESELVVRATLERGSAIVKGTLNTCLTFRNNERPVFLYIGLCRLPTVSEASIGNLVRKDKTLAMDL